MLITDESECLKFWVQQGNQLKVAFGNRFLKTIPDHILNLELHSTLQQFNAL